MQCNKQDKGTGLDAHTQINGITHNVNVWEECVIARSRAAEAIISILADVEAAYWMFRRRRSAFDKLTQKTLTANDVHLRDTINYQDSLRSGLG